MGEGESVSELAEVSAYENVAAEDRGEALTEKNAEKDELKEVEEEKKEGDNKDIENMDVDKEEVKESKEEEEEEKADKESKGAEEKPETKIELMEEETGDKPDKDVADIQKESVDKHEVEKGSKESDKSESGALKKDRKRKRQVEDKKEQEPKTPPASTIERPVRQRKSVERLVASIEGEATKDIHIEKGRGTALKDIPNVAYKLSKRKTDDTLKVLHTTLFGRRGKAAQFKSNILRFSGFVWHENEEKQKMKVKEKLDKCVKEKLLELCDVLDIPVAKATSKKEDIVSQLMDFLEAPHSMTSELLAEKDQSSKGKKRERVRKESPSSATGSLKGSSKSRKTESTVSNKAEKKKKMQEAEGESEEEDEQEKGKIKANGVHERSDDEASSQPESKEKDGESEDESESEKDKKKNKQSSNKSLSNKEPDGKVKPKKTPVSARPSPPPKKTPSKSSKISKHNDSNDATPKVYSKKKMAEVVKGKSSTPKKPTSKDNTGKKVLKGKDRNKVDKLRPSDDELRTAICEILKEVDFNTATFTDILNILAKRYDTDLTPRKSSVKDMIQDELTRLADEAEDEDEEEEEEEEGDAEEGEKQPSGQCVEA